MTRTIRVCFFEQARTPHIVIALQEKTGLYSPNIFFCTCTENKDNKRKLGTGSRKECRGKKGGGKNKGGKKNKKRKDSDDSRDPGSGSGDGNRPGGGGGGGRNKTIDVAVIWMFVTT